MVKEIILNLWFDQNALEFAKHYIEFFGNGKINSIATYPDVGNEITGMKSGSVMTVDFEFNGRRYIAINGGPMFPHTPAMSLMVECQDQREIDDYWNRFLAAGAKEVECGWLTDRFGVSWQVCPAEMTSMMLTTDLAAKNRLFAAMLKMKKLNIETLKKAFAGQ